MPTLRDVGFVLALGAGIFASIEALKWALRRRHVARLARGAAG